MDHKHTQAFSFLAQHQTGWIVSEPSTPMHAIKVVVEPSFAADVVALLAVGDRAEEAHESAEPAYGLPMSERPAAFARIATLTFEKWKCAAPIETAIGRYADLPKELDSLRLVAANSPTQEGADMLRQADGKPRHAALAIRATHFTEADFVEFIEIEIGRLNDLVDPGFGYDPDHEPQSKSPAGRKQAIGRLGVLWSATLAKRLNSIGCASPAGLELASSDVATWFGVPLDDAVELTQSTCAGSVSYAALVHAAEQPEKVLSGLGIETKLARARRGEPCPLCGFPTTSWADDASVASMRRAVLEDFPEWDPEAGVCDRCAEIFTQNGAFA